MLSRFLSHRNPTSYPLLSAVCVLLCVPPGRDLQSRLPGGARGPGEAEPEEGGAAGPADPGAGPDRPAQAGRSLAVREHHLV